MSRVQLALNVGNLDEAIAHYSKMFGVGPAKVRPGYANFAVANPPLKLVLIEGHGEAGTLNHLGVEVESTDEVASKIDEARQFGFDITVQESTTCCFAVQDKVWVHGPDGEPWEVYTVLADAATMHAVPAAVPAVEPAACCAPAAVTTPVTLGGNSGTCC